MSVQFELFSKPAIDHALTYPKFRYMGSKHKLLPWIYNNLKGIQFETVLDGFSGSGAVSYLFKTMNKEVTSNDFLHFSYIISKATLENNKYTLSSKDLQFLTEHSLPRDTFIQDTFRDIFFSRPDLQFLDAVMGKVDELGCESKKSLAIASLIRSCIKKQPRGVFTVSGDLSNYDDGRRDLKISMKDHFVEQVEILNNLVFDNSKSNKSLNLDIFSIGDVDQFDLVYLDPPYVPKSDDNCYIKRYHFLEGLSKYWEGEEIMHETKVKKIKKKYTPFSYRKTAIEAFDQMFQKFKSSTIVLSYSSNGFPDLKSLVDLMKKYKAEVNVVMKEHKYSFGTHKNAKRSNVEEYLIIGQS